MTPLLSFLLTLIKHYDYNNIINVIIIDNPQYKSVSDCMCFLKKNSEIFYLSENLHKFGADIGRVMYLPTLDPNNPTKELIEFFNHLQHENIELLDQQMNGFKAFYQSFVACPVDEQKYSAFEFILDLHSSSDAAFLVEVKLIKNIDQVNFNRDNELTGFDGDWGATTSLWVFAESMEAAMQQGILLGRKNLIKINKKDCV